MLRGEESFGGIGNFVDIAQRIFKQELEVVPVGGTDYVDSENVPIFVKNHFARNHVVADAFEGLLNLGALQEQLAVCAGKGGCEGLIDPLFEAPKGFFRIVELVQVDPLRGVKFDVEVSATQE